MKAQQIIKQLLRDALAEVKVRVQRAGARLNVASAAAVSIARNAFVQGLLQPKGFYTFTATGPVEHRRAEYVALRDRIQAAEEAHEKRRAPLPAQFVEWVRDLAAIPLEQKWSAGFANLITTAGKNDLWDKYLAGSSYTAAWYLGLVDNAGFSAYAAGDTMSSHAGWAESTAYSNSTRVAVSWNAASSGSKASTASAFTINATATLDGAFLTTGSAKGGTTGVLFSAGAFTGGDRSVANGDTLNVTYTASA